MVPNWSQTSEANHGLAAQDRIRDGCAIVVLTEVRRQEFERDFPAESGILGEVYLAHPTGADLLDDPVVRDHSAVG